MWNRHSLLFPFLFFSKYKFSALPVNLRKGDKAGELLPAFAAVGNRHSWLEATVA